MDVYTSIFDAPLDEYSKPDEGDAEAVKNHRDSFTQEFGENFFDLAVPLNEGTVNPSLVIPFTRTVELGTVGRDVIGAKRAIWNKNGLPVPVNATQNFGPTAVTELRKAQRSLGLTPDGKLGPTTLKKLARFFDAYAFSLYVGYPPGSSARERIIAYAVWGYNNRGAIGYAQYRPMAFMYDPQHLPINEDCSTFVTKAYKYANGPDPNGMHYNGFGNTETERANGSLITLAAARPGDLVHYDNPQHVGIFVGGSRVIEHGSSIGPLLVSVSYRHVVQVRKYL